MSMVIFYQKVGQHRAVVLKPFVKECIDLRRKLCDRVILNKKDFSINQEKKFNFNLKSYPKKQSISLNHFCKNSKNTERPLFWIAVALSNVCKTMSVLHHKAAIITCKHIVLNSVLVISRLNLSKTICKNEGNAWSILLWHWRIIISKSLAAWLSASSSSTSAFRTWI